MPPCSWRYKKFRAMQCHQLPHAWNDRTRHHPLNTLPCQHSTFWTLPLQLAPFCLSHPASLIASPSAPTQNLQLHSISINNLQTEHNRLIHKAATPSLLPSAQTAPGCQVLRHIIQCWMLGCLGWSTSARLV